MILKKGSFGTFHNPYFFFLTIVEYKMINFVFFSGVMLIISAILYMIKTKGSTEENELDKITQNASYDR